MKDLRDISSLHEWKDNPRNIAPKDFERLKGQISNLGQYKPLLITKDGEVIGGNMRLKAYNALGIKKVWVSVVKPKDDNEKLEYALSDNDRAGYYDDDMFANLIPNYDIDWSQYAVDMKPPEDIQQLIDRIAPVEEDEVPEVAEGEAVSKYGEVYQLGRHRLMCGDATKIGDVEKLMDGKKADMVFTDPPYSMYGSSTGLSGVSDDKMVRSFFRDVLVGCKNFTKVFGHIYCSCDWRSLSAWHEVAKGIPLPMKNLIVWHKQYGGKGNMYWSSFEFLMFFTNDPDTKRTTVKRTGQRTISGQSNIWYFDKVKVSEKEHNAQKPIELIAKAVKNSSDENTIVLDLFGGSGSTLIACEQTNRICYMMEIDPRYCDVIRKRYTKFIGKEEEWQTLAPIIK